MPPPAVEYKEDVSCSLPSTTLSSPVSSSEDLVATPASSAPSLEGKYADDDMQFPDYGGVHFYTTNERFEGSQSSDEPGESTATDTTRSDSPVLTPTVADDTAIKSEPKHHVDYLSHDWREEDIWSSWRHIVSQRKVYGQRSRLENASWRTWAKSKYHLRTVSPETLNWLKESDVTWLYGPLKPAESHPITANQSAPSSQISKNNSFVTKKPILKKRSMSEVMLQKSLSASSLLKQAAAAVQAQQGKPGHRESAFRRANSDFVSSALSTSEIPSRDQLDYFSSHSESDTDNACEFGAKRHIRFDDKVEQCIAVEVKGDDFDELSGSDSEDEAEHGSSSDNSSDDGFLTMKRRKKIRKSKASDGDAKTSRSNSHNGRKTIETLPSTTLKYRTDSPDVTAPAQQHHTFGKNWSPRTLSPSPSQETLRPSHPSRNFLLPEDDDDNCAESSSWSFGASNPKSSLGAASPVEDEPSRWTRKDYASSRSRDATPGPSRTSQPPEDEWSADGMRRTNSGMFMPYDEDEDDMMAVGLFGRVSETINTARDIAHVIWNVGWRK
ncbi:Fungal protein of unknown function (DUF1752) [Teratosphaeria destructans]|uniref:Nitrogen regulatory protein areA GATA-like domain-containing protein n=1 Tax=Teratosphaeria destructans TaxID=418781 RepID=A0A9W7SJH6_9PEZI|nr:Fungal protein of unknown function (DUF1752) [Teratosphaeria destructans]